MSQSDRWCVPDQAGLDKYSEEEVAAVEAALVALIARASQLSAQHKERVRARPLACSWPNADILGLSGEELVQGPATSWGYPENLQQRLCSSCSIRVLTQFPCTWTLSCHPSDIHIPIRMHFPHLHSRRCCPKRDVIPHCKRTKPRRVCWMLPSAGAPRASAACAQQ